MATPRIGFTCSCFDLFHAGHVLMLREAKSVCDHLIVGLQTDPTIDRPNKNAPAQSVFERFVQLQSCKYVDEIVVYATEHDLEQILLSYPINVRILGEEYRDQNFTGKEACQSREIDLHFNRRDHEFSTSELRRRITELNKPKFTVTVTTAAPEVGSINSQGNTPCPL